MNTLSLTDILDDLSAAEEGLHKFERRYWISSVSVKLMRGEVRVRE